MPRAARRPRPAGPPGRRGPCGGDAGGDSPRPARWPPGRLRCCSGSDRRRCCSGSDRHRCCCGCCRCACGCRSDRRRPWPRQCGRDRCSCRRSGRAARRRRWWRWWWCARSARLTVVGRRVALFQQCDLPVGERLTVGADGHRRRGDGRARRRWSGRRRSARRRRGRDRRWDRCRDRRRRRAVGRGPVGPAISLGGILLGAILLDGRLDDPAGDPAPLATGALDVGVLDDGAPERPADGPEPVVSRILSMISPFFRRALALTPSALAISRRVSLSFDSRIDCSSAAAATGVPLFSRPCGVTRRVMEFQERVADRCRPKIDPLNRIRTRPRTRGAARMTEQLARYRLSTVRCNVSDRPAVRRAVPRHRGRCPHRGSLPGRSNRSARWSGSAGRMPVARSTASGNFAGWAVASVTIGPPVRRRTRRAAAMPVAVCGSSSIAARGVRAPDLRERRGVVEARGAERARRCTAARWSASTRGDRSRGTGRAARRSCHRRGRSSRTAAARSSTTPGCPSTGSASARPARVVMSPSLTNRVRMSLALEATTKSADRRAHLAGRSSPASTLPKLPVGTRSVTGPAQRLGGGHVVDDLRHHPRPVDRVDRRQLHPLAERGVVEHRLDEVLAVVERALDGDGVDVRLRRPSSSAGAAPRSVRPRG